MLNGTTNRRRTTQHFSPGTEQETKPKHQGNGRRLRTGSARYAGEIPHHKHRVIHHFLLPATNVNTMVMPGYIAEVRTRFKRPGVYDMPCHEFCDDGHHGMWTRVNVLKEQFPQLIARQLPGDEMQELAAFYGTRTGAQEPGGVSR
jgi:hypothetical protein